MNDDEVRFVLDQHALLDIYSASSLKQQSVDRQIAPLGHIILIPSQPVFALSSDRHVAPLGHIILIPNQPVFALSPRNAACLAQKQQMPIL